MWILDLTLVHIQWDLVPESFNLGIYPLAHKRVDYALAPADTEDPSGGVISPWSVRKLFITYLNELLFMIRTGSICE